MDYPQKGDIWRHYKGNLYSVLYVAIDATSSLQQVVYQNEVGGTVWSRPLSDWMSQVCNAEYPKPVQRFTLEKRECTMTPS